MTDIHTIEEVPDTEFRQEMLVSGIKITTSSQRHRIVQLLEQRGKKFRRNKESVEKLSKSL